MKYVIISIEGRNSLADGEILFVKANRVRHADYLQHAEEMFGKTYFDYTLNECDDTDTFIFPFSKNLLQSLMHAHSRSNNPESIDSFWNPELSNFTQCMLYDEELGKKIMVYKHNSFTEVNPSYEFCIFTDVLPVNIKNERLFMVHANRNEIGKRSEVMNDFSKMVCCYFVLNVAEYGRFKEETKSAFWQPDLNHYICEPIKMQMVNRFTGEPTEVIRYMYISRDVPKQVVIENINRLPL